MHVFLSELIQGFRCCLNANAVLSQVTRFTLDNFSELLLFLEQHAEQVGPSSTPSVCLTSMHNFCQRHLLWPAYLYTVSERGVRMHSAHHLCCALTLHQKVSSTLSCRLRFGDSESLHHWNLYEKKNIAWSVHLFFLLIHLLELEKIWMSARAHSLEPMATAHRFGLNCYKTFSFGCDLGALWNRAPGNNFVLRRSSSTCWFVEELSPTSSTTTCDWIRERGTRLCSRELKASVTSACCPCSSIIVSVRWGVTQTSAGEIQSTYFWRVSGFASESLCFV